MYICKLVENFALALDFGKNRQKETERKKRDVSKTV